MIYSGQIFSTGCRWKHIYVWNWVRFKLTSDKNTGLAADKNQSNLLVIIWEDRAHGTETRLMDISKISSFLPGARVGGMQNKECAASLK